MLKPLINVGERAKDKVKEKAKVTFVQRHSSLQQKTVCLEEINTEYARKSVMEHTIIPNEGEGFFDNKTFTWRKESWDTYNKWMNSFVEDQV